MLVNRTYEITPANTAANSSNTTNIHTRLIKNQSIKTQGTEDN
jgi:hypothetical protein